MKTIWVIEQGCYSDYRIVGVFTCRENAQRVADAMKRDYDSPTIAEWPLDPAVHELNSGLRQWSVHMLKNGDTERVEPLEEFSSYDIAGEVRVWPRSQAPAFQGEGIPDVLTAIVWASDRDHALKIVNEQRIALIAAGKF